MSNNQVKTIDIKKNKLYNIGRGRLLPVPAGKAMKSLNALIGWRASSCLWGLSKGYFFFVIWITPKITAAKRFRSNNVSSTVIFNISFAYSLGDFLLLFLSRREILYTSCRKMSIKASAERRLFGANLLTFCGYGHIIKSREALLLQQEQSRLRKDL